MGVVKRKIYKSAGGRAYVVTLPKSWAEALKTKEVVLIYKGDYLIIAPAAEADKAIEAVMRKVIAE